MKTILAATALVLSITAAASAAETPRGSNVLAGGPILSPQTAYYVDCIFINLGSTNITPTTQELFESGSTTAISSLTSCTNGTPVAPNETCTIQNANTIPPDSANSCEVRFSSAATNVRGEMQLFDQNENPLVSGELR